MFSLFSASNTQQNCVIQSTRAAFSPQAVLRLSSQPNTNLAYSSASSGNFYKKKGDSALQSAFRYLGVCVCLVYPRVLVPQVQTGNLVKTQGNSLLDRVPKFLSDGNGGTMELRRKVICSESPT